MKKRFLQVFVLLMVISFVFALPADNNPDRPGPGSVDSFRANDDNTVSNQPNDSAGNGLKAATKNKVSTKEQTRAKSGNYTGPGGKKMHVETKNGFRFRVGGSEANSSLEMVQERDRAQNQTRLHAKLSNGRNAEIKVMPDTASKRAIEALQMKACSPKNNCTIELKEVGENNETKAAYEVKARKQARFLGIFKTDMSVHSRVDAENGQVIDSKKPWWAFLAAE